VFLGRRWQRLNPEIFIAIAWMATGSCSAERRTIPADPNPWARCLPLVLPSTARKLRASCDETVKSRCECALVRTAVASARRYASRRNWKAMPVAAFGRRADDCERRVATESAESVVEFDGLRAKVVALAAIDNLTA